MTAIKINAAEIKKIMKAGNVVLGTERTIKSLKKGHVQKVMVSSNCAANAERDISHYAGLSGAEFHKLDVPNDELGVICKKPFSVSVLAVLKVQGK